LARAPFVVLRKPEPNHRSALRTDEILAREPDGPAEACRLGHDLVEGVHRFRPPDPRNPLHLLAAFEELHAERDCAQLQKALQIGNELAPVLTHVGISRRGVGRNISLGMIYCLAPDPVPRISPVERANGERRKARAIPRRPPRPASLFEDIPST